MAKSTHQGTCQICGATQKLPSGVLSKHGYTIDFGWFNGVCHGAHHAPFEESCDLIADHIEACKAHLKNKKEFAQSLETDTSKVYLNIYRNNKYEIVVAHKEQLETTYFGENNEYSKVQFPYEWVDYRGNMKKNYMEIAAYGCHGETIEAKIIHQNKEHIKRLENQIAQIEAHIAWQSDRVANWKPGKLVAIDPKSNGPVMHLEVTRRNTKTAACKYSAMAMQKFNGFTTTDETKVTCKGCLKAMAEK